MGNTEIKEAEYYPVLGAAIVSHKNVESKYTVYVIQVTTDIGKWIAQRRYSDFKRLHDELAKRFPSHHFPVLPERKIFGNLDPEFIQDRKRKLNDYLNLLITTSSDFIMASPEMLTFFDAFNPTFIVKNDEPLTGEIEIRTRSSSAISDLMSPARSSLGSLPEYAPSAPSTSGSYPNPQVHPAHYFHNQSCSEMEYTQLYSWLESVALAMYIQSFVNNGFTLELLKYYGITEFQLNSMQIIDPSHRTKILNEVNKLRQETYTTLGIEATSPKDEDESKFCVICFEGYKDTLLAPCGHVCCCMDCATALEAKKETCPVCRKAITSVYKAFIV